MKEIQKPIFFKNYSILPFAVIPTLVGFFSDTIPEISKIKIWNFSLSILIAIGILIIGTIIYTIVYIYKLNKYCTQIENNNLGLKNDNSQIKEKNLKLENERKNIALLNQNIIYHLQQGIINISDEEKNYLKELLNIIDNLTGKEKIDNEK